MIYKVYFTETSNNADNPYSHKKFLGLWEKKDGYLSDVRYPCNNLSISENGNIIDILKKTSICKIYLEDPDPEMTVDIVVEETNQVRGIYYPRIYRSVCSDDDLSSVSILGRDKKTIESFNIPIDENLFVNSIEQLNTLTELLNKILRTVFPCSANFKTYGFDIRNLIILSATEFEAQITGILKVNRIKPFKNYKMEDFFESNGILKLSEYEVKFSRFPDIPKMSPFDAWKNTTSFKSLDWYKNYNTVKHDREDNFHKARLIDLLNSISACYILLLVQYGNRPIINESLSNYWQIVKLPQFDISEKLISPLKDNEWIMKKYNC